jgi:hypothetical protein
VRKEGSNWLLAKKAKNELFRAWEGRIKNKGNCSWRYLYKDFVMPKSFPYYS